MNPRPPEPIDPVTMQPRRVPWLRWTILGTVLLLVMAGGVWLWVQKYTRITVARDTTWLIAPLKADGYPDYGKYLHDINAEEITPENNAWVVLLRGMDCNELGMTGRTKSFTALGIPLPTLQPGALLSFDSTAYRNTVPHDVLLASFAAAQIPWSQRLARSAALSMVKFAESPWLDSATAADFAVDEEEFSPLRPDSLGLLQPPELTTAEELATWRKKHLELAREKIFGREQAIIEKRPWSRAECPIAAHWVETQGASLDRLVREFLARPRFYAPSLTSQPDELLGNGGLVGTPTLRVVCELLQFRARESIEGGDLAAALRDFDWQLRLSTYNNAKPILVDVMVGLSMHGKALETARDIAAHSGTTEEQLAALAQRLEQRYPFPDFATGLDQDRLIVLDYIVGIAARGQKADSFPNDDYWRRSIICWDDVLRRFNELHDAAIVAVKARDWPAMQQLMVQIETQPAHYLELQAALQEPSRWLLPSQRTEVVKYALPRALVAFKHYRFALRDEVRHDAARVMIALERFRRANNAYPAALAELVPTYLPAVPNDPFDSKPMKYFRTPRGGYRAYSVWQNGIDDGGVPNVHDEDASGMDDNDLVIGSPDEIPQRLNLAW